jgi:hypothetical protein
MIISIVGFAAAAVFLAVTVLLFFRLNIPGVIGIVTGRTASRNIQKIWDESRSVDLATGEFDFFRRENTAPIPQTTNPQTIETPIPTGTAQGAPTDSRRPEWSGDSTELLQTPGADDETQLLSEAQGEDDETQLLSEMPGADDETQLLSEMPGADDETQLLSETTGADDETQLLSETMGVDDETQLLAGAQGSVFRIVRSETSIHTDQVIHIGR